MEQIQNIIPELQNLKKYSNLLNKTKINELGFDSFTRIIRNKSNRINISSCWATCNYNFFIF